MGTIRTYFTKNNTIVKNSAVNTGRNPVSELYYGNRNSRFLFYCDFTDLKEKYRNKELIIDDTTKHILNIKPTSSFDIMPYLNEENNLVFGNMQRATSFDLELKELLKDWDEGIGYDFNPNESRKPYDQAYSNDISNWFGMTGDTLGDVITTGEPKHLHLDKGNEDIIMDVTDFVNNIITGDTEYKGFCLKYTDEFENPTGITKFDKNEIYAFGLFTRHTQSFFEPFIESTFDDVIKDDRGDFYLKKTNRLYLYFSVDGKNENFDELPTCEIAATDDFTGVTLNVKQQSRGVYYVEVEENDLFNANTLYNDIWDNLKFDGKDLKSKKMSFVPKVEEDYYLIGENVLNPIKYGVSLSGIKSEEKMHQGEKRRINVLLRKPYTVNQVDVVTKIYYKLYIKRGQDQTVVTDWLEVNKTYGSNFFTIDTSWLIPQTYFIDIKVDRNGETNIYNEELKFIILNKK